MDQKIEVVASERLTVPQAEVLIKQLIRDDKRFDIKSDKKMTAEDVDRTVREIVQVCMCVCLCVSVCVCVVVMVVESFVGVNSH